MEVLKAGQSVGLNSAAGPKATSLKLLETKVILTEVWTVLIHHLFVRAAVVLTYSKLIFITLTLP